MLIGRAEIAKKSRFTMQIHASMCRYLEKLNELSPLKGAVLIYSMWHGYRSEGKTAELISALEKMGVEIVELHTSGHADKSTIERLERALKPRKTIFVHTEG